MTIFWCRYLHVNHILWALVKIALILDNNQFKSQTMYDITVGRARDRPEPGGVEARLEFHSVLTQVYG